MKIVHCRVLKPFDRYDNAGAVASLSEAGFARMANSKMRDFVEVLCIERENGDVEDAVGNVVVTAKERKGATIDPFAIEELIKGAAPTAIVDREEKKSRTR